MANICAHLCTGTTPVCVRGQCLPDLLSFQLSNAGKQCSDRLQAQISITPPIKGKGFMQDLNLQLNPQMSFDDCI